MAYSNTVVDYVAELEQERGPMVSLHKHLLAVAFQLAALRDAWAIAWSGSTPCQLLLLLHRMPQPELLREDCSSSLQCLSPSRGSSCLLCWMCKRA